MLVVVQFVLILLALSRDTIKSLVRSSKQLWSLIWPDSMYNKVDCKFSYCRLIFLVCATATPFSSRTKFTFQLISPIKISTFSGHLLSRILLFYDITDISYWIFSSDYSFLILVLFRSTVIELITPRSFCTLETEMILSADMVFALNCKSATLLLINFSSSVRWTIYCFCWFFATLRLSVLNLLVLRSLT